MDVQEQHVEERLTFRKLVQTLAISSCSLTTNTPVWWNNQSFIRQLIFSEVSAVKCSNTHL